MFYPIRLALKSLLFDRWINLLTILTIGTGLFILGAIMLTLINLKEVSRRLPERFSITVFLSDTVGKDEISSIESLVKRDSLVQKVRYISRDEAMEELRASLKDAAYILEGLDENPLFPSIVINLRRDGFDKKRVEKLINDIRGIKGVEDIIYGEKLLSSIQTFHRGFRSIAAGLIVLFLVAIVFVCYSTVKILFNRRKEEIGIFKLLGATRVFIRTPFIIEGSTLGLLGGLFGLASIYGLYTLLSRYVLSGFPMFPAIHFPKELASILPAIGLTLGVIGSVIALGRIRY